MSPEARRQVDFLASAGPLANTTADKKDTHDILMETGGNILARGLLYNIKSVHLGADVYRLSLELANPALRHLRLIRHQNAARAASCSKVDRSIP